MKKSEQSVVLKWTNKHPPFLSSNLSSIPLADYAKENKTFFFSSTIKFDRIEAVVKLLQKREKVIDEFSDFHRDIPFETEDRGGN